MSHAIVMQSSIDWGSEGRIFEDRIRRSNVLFFTFNLRDQKIENALDLRGLGWVRLGTVRGQVKIRY